MFEFKGELQNLTPRQLEFISDVLRKHQYVGTEVCVENVGEKGDNYGSQVKRIKVQFGNGKEFKIIAKILPNNMKQNEIVNSVFMNEIIMFNEVLPKFRELQEYVDIPEEDLFKYPVCYGALNEIDNEIILIEDLEISNFKMLVKTNTLNNDTVKLVLKNIANFHSMSYVLKNKKPQLLNKLSESLFDPMFNSKNVTQPEVFFDGVIQDFRTMFNTSKYKDIILNVMENFVKTWKKLISSDRGSKYSVILHGDLWTNNIMFQIQNGSPVNCTFIDYQMSRELIPVADIHYFIFNCTDYKTRSKHYHEWIDYYHSELERYLDYFNLKVKYIYPKDKFDTDLKRYGKAALGSSFFVLNLSLRESQEAPDLVMKETMEGNEQIPQFQMEAVKDVTFDIIKDRVEGLIESCFDYGYISEIQPFF